MDEEKQKINHSLVALEKYLESGVHIGSRFKSGDMKKFIYKCRSDGLCVLDITALNDRILAAAKFLSRYEPSKILIVAGRNYAQKPAKKLAEMVGAKAIIGRFIPGTLTNSGNENFMEPEVIFTADPPVDGQAVRESIKARIPVVSLCDTSNMLKNVDLAIPCNNKGKKALALIYWLLAREILRQRGIIKSDSEFTPTMEEFESKAEREEKDLIKLEERKPPRYGASRFGRGRDRDSGRGRSRRR
jgi:small subunit ribosomal protein S2